MDSVISQKPRLKIVLWYHNVFLPKIKNMAFSSIRLKERRAGLDKLDTVLSNINNCLVIHYSCESFKVKSGKTPRVTSISVRNLGNTQTESFSIHLQAQFDGLDFTNLTDEQYDVLEKKVLTDFYEFVKANKKHNWIHWNMRDSNYGFHAIANRYRILKGKPFVTDDDRKFDFPKILEAIYTANYERRDKGRFLNLAKRNKITTSSALTGEEEAEAFASKNYLDLHMSTLRKVEIISTIIDYAHKRRLKVATKKIHIYGLTPAGIAEMVKNSLLLAFICTLIGGTFWAIAGPKLQTLFNTLFAISK